MNILVFGHICIDDNEIEKAKYESFGGTSMYMSFVLNKLGSENLEVVSYHGEDFRKYLKDIEIFPKEPKFKTTQRNFNRMVNGTPKTVKVLNTETSMEVEITDELKEKIHQADLIFIAPLIPSISVDYISEIFKHSNTNTQHILLPQGYFRNVETNGEVTQREFEEMKEILPLFDFVIMSSEDHPRIDSEIVPMIKNSDSTLIVTMGRKGARYINKLEDTIVPTNMINEENIIDSVGSGDIFSASFGYSYSKTKDIKKSVEFGNEIAGKCLKFSAVDIYNGNFSLE